MIRYILRRLFHTVFVLFGISLIVFVTVRLTGNPVAAMLQGSNPSVQAMASLEKALGLNQPYIVQYWIFIKGIATLNFGTSFVTGQPVLPMIWSRLGATALLAIGGIVVGVLIAIPVGILSAIRYGTILDVLGRGISLLGISFPNYWLATMLILIFSVDLHWFPVAGSEGFSSLVLPSFTLGFILAGILARLVRTSMLETLGSQYIVTARAKGLTRWRVIIVHALRNALLPTITFMGIQFGGLLGGVVILEEVFSWPGIGRLVLTAVNERDYPVVQASVLLLSFLYIMVNLVVDLSYAFLDPRIRIGD
ncbi:MAG: ABC transporter permease [Firmicutes bacterium]|nr:ABC transporter permease [Bacillota bacterium]